MFIQRNEMGNIVDKHYNFGDQSLYIAVGGGGGAEFGGFLGVSGGTVEGGSVVSDRV